jgi:hypothetical protein
MSGEATRSDDPSKTLHVGSSPAQRSVAVLRAFRNTFLLLIFAASPQLFYSQETSRESDYRSFMERGYALSESKPAEALVVFRQAFELVPSDSLALQIAFLLNGLDRNQEALEAFMPLQFSPDPSIQEQARSAVYVLDDMKRSARSPYWLRTSTAALYDSRFRDGILWLTLQGGRHLNESKTISATLTLGIDADTRSDGTRIIPEIFSDNYVLLAPGLRVLPFSGATLDVAAGIAHDIKFMNRTSRTRGDVRAILSYGLGSYPVVSFPDRLRLAYSFFAEAGLSSGYYSRYENGITYVEMRGGMRFLEWGPSAFDGYLRLDLAADTKREFYNNYAEAGIGIRIIPHHAWSVSFAFEAKRGSYLGGTRSQSPDGTSYGTFRTFLILDRFF